MAVPFFGILFYITTRIEILQEKSPHSQGMKGFS